MLVDTHVHLDFYDSAEEIKAVVERAAAQNVQVLIAVGYDLNSCKKAVELSELFPNVYAVIGIHPHEA
jgi:TatD DNase family protein